jgi:hypothetical protein
MGGGGRGGKEASLVYSVVLYGHLSGGLRVTTRIMRVGFVPEECGTSQLQIRLLPNLAVCFCHGVAVHVVNDVSGFCLYPECID